MKVEGREEAGEDDGDNLLWFEERTSRIQEDVTKHSMLVRHDGQVPEVFDWHSVQLDLHVGGSVNRRHRARLEVRVLAGAFVADVSLVPSVGIGADEESGITIWSCGVKFKANYSTHWINDKSVIFGYSNTASINSKVSWYRFDLNREW